MPTEVIMAPPNACRGMPRRLRSRLRSDVSQAPRRKAQRQRTRRQPREQGLAAAKVRVIACLDRRATAGHLPGNRDRGLGVGVMNLDSGQLLAVWGGHDEERIHAFPVVLAATRQAHSQLGHRRHPVRDRPANEMGHCEVNTLYPPDLLDVAEQSARIQLKVTVELRVHRAAPRRTCQLPPALHTPRDARAPGPVLTIDPVRERATVSVARHQNLRRSFRGPAEPFSRHLLGGRTRGQYAMPGAVDHLGGGVADLLLDLGERLASDPLRGTRPRRR